MRYALPLLLLLTLPLAACDSNDDDVVTLNSTVVLAYEGRLENGTVFDSSDRATFPIAGTIDGFRDNVLGMRVGETKTFTVPPEEGYGNQQVGSIPPNSTLIFDVEVLDIR